MQNKFDFKGFWAALIAMLAPLLTDENLFAVALWLVRLLLTRAVNDAEKYDKIVNLAEEFVSKVGKFIDELKVTGPEVTPSFMVKK